MKILIKILNHIFLAITLISISTQFILSTSLTSILEKIETTKNIVSKQDYLSSEPTKELKEQFNKTFKEIEDYIEENAATNDKILFVYSEVAKATNLLIEIRDGIYKFLKKIKPERGAPQPFSPLELQLGLQGLVKRMDSILKLQDSSLKRSPQEDLSQKNQDALKVIRSMAQAIKVSAITIYDNFSSLVSSSKKQSQTNFR